MKCYRFFLLLVSVFQNATFPFASDVAVCRRPVWPSLEDQSPCARVLIKRAFLRPMFSLLRQRVGVGSVSITYRQKGFTCTIHAIPTFGLVLGVG